MATAEIDAARRHLKEVKELSESRRIIKAAEERLQSAEAAAKPRKVEEEKKLVPKKPSAKKAVGAEATKAKAARAKKKA